jgi:hypothetical protein
MIPIVMAISVVSIIAVFGCCAILMRRQGKSRLAMAPHVGPDERLFAFLGPAALGLERRSAPVAGRPTEVSRVGGLTMRQAEDLLDWLEQNGYTERRVVCEADQFTVEFCVDAGSFPRESVHVEPGAPKTVAQ